MTRLSQPVRGFNLLELLVSAALLAMIGSVILTSLSSSIDTKEEVDAVSDRYHQVRTAMSRMTREISMAYLSGHRNSVDPTVITRFEGGADSLQFVAFGHRPMRANAKESDQRELGYTIDHDPISGTQSIMRRVQPNPDVDTDEGGRTQVLCENVRELTFEYWDARKEDWVEEWDTDDARRANQLPPRVRITFTAVMQNGIEETFTTQTRIRMLAPLNF